MISFALTGKMTSLAASNATPILCADDDEWTPIVNKSAQTKTPFVVAFGAGWCGPCKVLKPIFRALAKEWTAKDPANAPIFVEVDVDEGGFWGWGVEWGGVVGGGGGGCWQGGPGGEGLESVGAGFCRAAA